MKLREIKNPYDSELNMCFGCSRKNPIGLKLDFKESEDAIHAVWSPAEKYQGYPNIVHGGIISALLDEIGAWCVSVKIGTAGVTTQMIIKYLAPVYVNKGDVNLTAEIISSDGKNASIRCSLHDSQSKLCSEAVVDYFLYPVEIAVRRFRYPGKDAFHTS